LYWISSKEPTSKKTVLRKRRSKKTVRLDHVFLKLLELVGVTRDGFDWAKHSL